MSDDTRRILEMLAKGKLTVEEADQLLRAIGSESSSASATPPQPAERPKPRYVRISLHKPACDGKNEKDVNIRVPIAVVKSGMRLGAMIPDLANERVAAQLRERGLDVDFSKLDSAALEAMMLELGDADINIDAGKAQVRITCE